MNSPWKQGRWPSPTGLPAVPTRTARPLPRRRPAPVPLVQDGRHHGAGRWEQP